MMMMFEEKMKSDPKISGLHYKNGFLYSVYVGDTTPPQTLDWETYVVDAPLVQSRVFMLPNAEQP